ncbi:MAG TPA: peptidylprolyl isomerase [Pyrinomonadaceae bacterium]
MSSTTKAIIAAGIAIALAAGLIFWQAKGGAARTVNLSADDMALIVEGMPPQARMALARSDEERKEFAKNIREMFAVAEEGRKAGVADKPEVKRQIELMNVFVVAQSYEMQQREAGKKPDETASKDEIEAFKKEAGQDKKFEEFMQDVQKMGLLPPGDVPEEQKTQMRDEWARISVLHRKGVAAGIDKDPKTRMQIKLQEARLIATNYATSDEMKNRMKATDQEIADYIAKHPELDPKQARTKAEDLLKRARGGEDFAKLADEFTDDPSGKGKGGDLGWFGKGRMMEAFEKAAFDLKVGEISEVVETPYGFHVIKVEERGMKDGADGKPEEQVHARHILIRTGSTNQMGMPQSPQDQARAAVEAEKREKLLGEILQRTKVTVAENFQVKAPEMPAQMPMMPPGAAPGGEPAPLPESGGNPPPPAPPGGNKP